MDRRWRVLQFLFLIMLETITGEGHEYNDCVKVSTHRRLEPHVDLYTLYTYLTIEAISSTNIGVAHSVPVNR